MSRSAEILKKVKRIEITTRQMVDSILSGSYHTKFKGHGMQFADLREYYLGDDIRHIDWKVTARTQSAHIKKFEEERELQVYFLVDMSASGLFGSKTRLKIDAISEICAFLAFAAVRNNDKVGMILFTDQVEKHIPPKKGLAHAMRLVSEVLYFQPQHKGTKLQIAFDYCYRVMKSRGVVFVVSDFFDKGFESSLKKLRRRHQVIAIKVQDPTELEIPNVGYVEIEDAETGQQRVVNTGSYRFREKYKQESQKREESIANILKASNVERLMLDSTQDYFKKIIEYFGAKSRGSK